jgi:adenylate cyclase
VRCALALDAFAQDYAAKARADGIDLGVTRIGVHSGAATIGNFGGSTFFDYTAHGDAVNTAARLESVNKHIGTRICVSGETAGHCPGIAFRPIGDLVLKGKEEAISTFEPVPARTNGYADPESYSLAFDDLANGGMDAEAAFRALSETAPEDPLVRFHAARIAGGARGIRIVFSEK